METNLLIIRLRNRLIEYQQSQLYKNIALRQDILSITIALSLFEIALFCNREITHTEKYWFEGGYYIANDITGEWNDIASMYDQIVSIAKAENFI